MRVLMSTNTKKLVNSRTIRPPHHKTNKMICAPSEDSDQPGHPPSLIRGFAVRMKKDWVLNSYPLSAQRRLWWDWADAQVDLSLRWAHSHFAGFVMRRLNSACLLVTLHSIVSVSFPTHASTNKTRHKTFESSTNPLHEPRQANLCLRAFRHDKF